MNSSVKLFLLRCSSRKPVLFLIWFYLSLWYKKDFFLVSLNSDFPDEAFLLVEFISMLQIYVSDLF